MNFPVRILRAVRRLLPRNKDEKGDSARRKYNRGYYTDKEDISYRWDDIAQVVDLRPNDRVLDMGCAEGRISFEVAKHVGHVDGMDIARHLIEGAICEAAEKKIKNVSFSVSSVLDYRASPKSYDVVLFLGVMGKRAGDRRVGLAELEQMLIATRRQIIVRVNVEKRANLEDEGDFRLHEILAMMDRQDFDAICFTRREGQGNLVVGNRRSSDARLRSALPLAIVPTEMMRNHPCLRDLSLSS